MERRGGGLRRRVGARGGGEGAYAAVVNTGVLWMDVDGRFIYDFLIFKSKSLGDFSSNLFTADKSLYTFCNVARIHYPP